MMKRTALVLVLALIDCGLGEDRVSADEGDIVADDCEFVNGRRR